MVVEGGLQPADESDCSLGSSRDHFADKVCGFSHWFALPIAAGFCPSLAFLFLHHVVEPTPIHFPLHKQTEIVREAFKDGMVTFGAL